MPSDFTQNGIDEIMSRDVLCIWAKPSAQNHDDDDLGF